MKSSWRDISIALAGILQSAALVEQLAKTGFLDTDQFKTAVNSLFITSPKNTLEVYGSLANLRPGLEKLDLMLSHYRKASSSDLFRYSLGVMHIQKRLNSKPKVLNVISDRLARAEHQACHFGNTHDNVIKNISEIYSDTISKFQYRIQVTGNYHYLQQDRVASQVRTLLLASIRSSMLWRQLGGSRWQFLLHRDDILSASHTLLKEAKHEELSITREPIH